MPQKSYEGKQLSEKIDKLKEIHKEYSITIRNVFETLKKLKKTQIEYINLVKEHQEYWSSELEKTSYKNTVRREKLKETLKKEEKIFQKMEEGLKHTDERIEFYKKHLK